MFVFTLALSDQAYAQTISEDARWSQRMVLSIMERNDILDYFRDKHQNHDDLMIILEQLVEALVEFEDEESGVWYLVVVQGEREGNNLEASTSIMFTYAIA